MTKYKSSILRSGIYHMFIQSYQNCFAHKTIINHFCNSINFHHHEEDEKNPLNDDEMVLVLMRKNAKIARRTITKYRKELNILPASKRKRIF